MNTQHSYPANPASRLQQQPSRVMNRQQQQSSGSGEFQPRQSAPPRSNGQMGASWGDQSRRNNGF